MCSSHALMGLYLTGQRKAAQYCITLPYYRNKHTLGKSTNLLHADTNFSGFIYRQPHVECQPKHCYRLKADSQISTPEKAQTKADSKLYNMVKRTRVETNDNYCH